jgi:tetratricopeptide (TPR) repeat protein
VSQSPVEVQDPDEDYRKGWAQILDLVNSGGSWSGHERNCCFLNTGGDRFADASAVTGLDFLDDGRSVAAVDWDLDGDLDLWMTARTAPRMRFVRNDTRHETGGSTHYVAFKLQGTTANRGAIGAKVTLRSGERIMVRSLKAGDGYLTQASHWLHFGLGDVSEIDQVSVRWPGGQEEQFSAIQADQRFQLVQGEGAAKRWQTPERVVALTPSRIEVKTDPTANRVPIIDRIPLPPLDYVDFSAQPQSIPSADRSTTLVSIWAAWCQPCLVELKGLADHKEELAELGVRVVALSVDGLGEDASDERKAKAMVERLSLPFDTGMANPQLLNRLDGLQEALVALRRQPDSLPVSYLLDEYGRLAVIYTGAIDMAILRNDAVRLRDGKAADASVTGRGRWLAPARPNGAVLIQLAKGFHTRDDMVAAGLYAGLAADYLLRSGLDPGSVDSLATVLYDSGSSCLINEEWERARQDFYSCIRLRPTWAEAHSNLGFALRKLDETLLARSHFNEALNLAPSMIQPAMNLGLIELDDGNLTGAVDQFQFVLDLHHDSADGHNYLGVAYARMGQQQAAIQHLQLGSRFGSKQAARNLLLIQQGRTP